ncbi:hypothetical protein [Undibacterium sp.]|nr:hypothetical protein [Undibacterium sp.]MDP1978039.1 hypothetical protein [Undibacterium sp.]
MKYLPSLSKISQDTISYAIGMLLVAYIVAKSPKLKALVKDYQT